MGIKGIYGEIGPGKRVALSKLAVDKLEKDDRPLRIAIDISIWLFQNQAAKGGTNPALRTLYYRLLRLLSLSIQPIFVFDGPNKPKIKRNKRVGSNGASLPAYLAKQVITLFGFPCHSAPGEAEAECALLQREGVVDAVLSEDVDTLMFGCGVTLRNWSSENHNGSPTHVSMYEAEETRTGKSGLDRQGMILVAMMSGGDYITEGIPGCGVKTACEAARAGFGKVLCGIDKSSAAGYKTWKERLLHEIQTNESEFFRVKRKVFKIPEDFPNREVLGYYTNPVVSTSEKIATLKMELKWNTDVDIAGLRLLVADAFEWTGKVGAIKYIRGLAPALLTSKLLTRGNRPASGLGDLILTAMEEMDLVRSITGQRVHFSTDGMAELRLNFVPNDIVGLDLEAEVDESLEYGRSGLAITADDAYGEDEVSDQKDLPKPDNYGSPRKRGPSTFDPTVIDKVWIPRTIAKLGIPLKVEDYEEALRTPQKPAKKVAKPRATTKKSVASNMPKGALDGFFKTSRPTESRSTALEDPGSASLDASQSTVYSASEDLSEPDISKQLPKGKVAAREASKKIDIPPSRTTRTRTTQHTGNAKTMAKIGTNPKSSFSSLPVTRQANKPIIGPKLRSKAPAKKRSASPQPEQSQSRLQSSVAETNSEANSENHVTPRKKQLPLESWLRTPPSKAVIQTPVSCNIDIKVPFSHQKVNRKLDLSPMASTPARRGFMTRESGESSLSTMFVQKADLFSANAKGGSSFNVSRDTSTGVDYESFPTSSSKNVDREVITIDSSSPGSPTPLCHKKAVYVDEKFDATTEGCQTDFRPASPTPFRKKPGTNSQTTRPTLLNSRNLKAGNGRRFLAPRSSLEGSWKELDESEIRGWEGKAWAVDEIEVIDLSGC